LENIRRQAINWVGQPWPVPLAHAYARYWRDGDREEYQTSVFSRRDRLTSAATMAVFEGTDAWLDEVADGVVGFCEQSTWCWPAHDDTFVRHGYVVPNVDHPFVDLGAGEVAAQLAAIDSLLGAAIEQRYPGLRQRVKYETSKRVFRPFVERRDWHWLGLTSARQHNWNPWIHGNLLLAALQLIDDQEELGLVVELCRQGIQRYVDDLPGDGAIDEGFDYWWQGAARALEADELLRLLPGVAALTGAALTTTIDFPCTMSLGQGWVASFSDAVALGQQEICWHVLYRAAKLAGNARALSFAAAQLTDQQATARIADGLPRLLRALADPSWGKERPAAPLAGQTYLPSTQMLIARRQADSATGLTVAVKGGHNGENHNHLDVGSLIVASDSVPVVVDPGRPTYTAVTFGPDRYQIWTMTSDWHCVPQIGGLGQGIGQDFGAESVSVLTGANEVTFRADIGTAYPISGLSWLRSVTLDRRDGSVRVVDRPSIVPPGRPMPYRLFFVLAGQLRLDGDHGATVWPVQSAPAVRLTWDPMLDSCLTVRSVQEDQMLSGSWGSHLTRLELSSDLWDRSWTLLIEQLPTEKERDGYAV
jgi:hypothetical protein